MDYVACHEIWHRGGNCSGMSGRTTVGGMGRLGVCPCGGVLHGILLPLYHAHLYFQLQDSDSVFQLPKGVWVLALSIGLQTDTLLLVNNFRDRHTDAAVGKRTLATLLGERCTLLLYATVGCVAVGLACIGIAWIKGEWCITSALPCLMLPLHIWLSIQMKRIYQGAALNALLGQTALSILLFSLLTTLSLVM